MKRILAAALAAALALPALAQSPPGGAGGPSITLTMPCSPAAMALAGLKQNGFARVAKGRDVDGDPFALYRRGDGQWRAVVLVQDQGGGVFACALLGGDGLSVGDVGEGA